MFPSYLKNADDVIVPVWDTINNDVRLRVGTIVKVYAPGAPESRQDNQTEYDIRVVWSDSHNNTNTVYYPRVKRASLFGSMADKFEYSLRAEKHSGYTLGAQVLLACVNGHQQQAYIIGGIPHASQKESLEGHSLHFEFNGVRVWINDSGECTITRNGPTNDDGTPRDESQAAGTSIQLQENGNIAIVGIGENPKRILLDVDGDKVLVDSGNGKVSISAGALEVNEGSEGLLRGSTYRKAESQMLKDIAASLRSVAANLALTAAELSANAPMAAGPKLLDSSKELLKSSIAIEIFEAQSGQYVSDKHKID